MANICDTYTLDVPTGDITFNDEAVAGWPGGTVGDTYITTDIQGLDGAPIRAVIDDVPQGDGGLLFPLRLGARHITFEGFIGIRSENFGVDKAAYIAQIDAAEQALIDALDFVRQNAVTLTTPIGTIEVWNDSPVLFSGDQFAKKFIFGLVAPAPAIGS